jgi:DNA-binding PadR family transcriptional regulator
VNVTYPTALVLEAIAAGVHHGFDIMDATSLPSGSVYPILRRLEHEGLVRSRWEKHEIAQREGRPPRRYYEVERAGVAWLETARGRFRLLAEAVARPRRLKPARAEG